ncbi:glycosyltransferase [Microbacterium sp. nov. GSS16]|uniref:glycosyltransferase n=1 Tax=Microbacterium sp. nov. GSS16 TaxID=3019890 RepID=UPI00230679F3|nr:glycosyltransferase [Microbacterium sp. nov. GSS16]WCD92898.1 glycosyltransferase [Microbacterium sp. nov. GSS16]
MQLLVITNHDSAADLSEWLARDFLPDEIEVRAVGSRHQRLPHRLRYLFWLAEARKAVRLERHDPIYHHHVTFASELTPPPFVASSSALKVWGPVGSKQNPHVHLVSQHTPDRYGYFIAYALLAKVKKIALALNVARSRPDIIFTQALLGDTRIGSTEVEYFPNTVILDRDGDVDPVDSQDRDPSAPRILAVARIIPLKRLEIAVELMARPEMCNATLAIIGQPPAGKENYLSSIVEELGVGSQVEFLGSLPPQDVLRHMTSSTVLLHPSSSEGSCGVIGEAVSVGLPVICFDETGAADSLRLCGGHGEIVDPSATDPLGAIAAAVKEISVSVRPEPNDYWGPRRMHLRLTEMLEAARRAR